MSQLTLRSLSRLFALLVCSCGGLLAARGDVVLDWNGLLLDEIRADDSGPTLGSRSLAILHAAIYDAVNSVLRTHQPYQFQSNAPAGASAEAAAVGAAYEVATTLYPTLAGWADALYQQWLSNAPPGDALTNGLIVGQTIGQLAVQARDGDGSSTDIPYIPSDLPGQWRRTPPFFRPPLAPQWRYVTPFCLADIEPFVPPPPPALESQDYAAALNEVETFGQDTNSVRNAEQSQIAKFWSDFSYTCTPPGHMFLVAANIGRDHGNSLAENARLFALMALAQADCGIVCWEAKYRYNLWRPITAIQRANEVNNPATQANTTWNSFLVTPNFPSYTSGHSTFSKASTQVLTHFYGTDAITFTVGCDTLPGIFRTFSSLAACADEVGRSRIYAGIHYRFDKDAGSVCGAKIGDHVSANFLLPNDQLPLVRLEAFESGAPVLRIHGHIGRACVLEACPDLIHWKGIFMNQAVAGGIVFTDTNSIGQPRTFYRVRE